MKTCVLLQYLILPASLSIAGSVQAACQEEPPEIGDIGPDVYRVCSALEQKFPSTDIQVTNRKIYSPYDVVIFAQVNGKPVSKEYRLVMTDWVASADTWSTN